MRRLLLLTLAFALPGCRGRAAMGVAGLDVVDRTAADEQIARPSADQLREIVRAALDDPVLRWDDSSPAARRLRVELVLRRTEIGGRGVLRAEISLGLISSDAGDAPIESSGVIDGGFGAGTANDVSFVRRHLARAIRDVGVDLLSQARVWSGDAETLVRALGDGDAALREFAIRAAAARRERKAVPALIEILRGSDDALSEAAIGALAAIGDRRAVRPLCDHAGVGDARAVVRVIDAVASLGGPEAVAYLELLASGHDDPGIQSLARQALARMERLRR